ncbi:hypothetical protein QC761_406610 [Podospora bellae-mahoneyi]|uniref:Potassium channel domain-containing protein n=1 Tax=Podospora bellae-mahoneyi TaxID=2093777 RepID=A0ABR0FI50_9PEZI|nr:hypothetical protein QC761_406610 [Podospora bellae-mahoneyi]
MNDAGGEKIDEHLRAADPDGKKLPKQQEHEQMHLDPSRWWFASSAFPMIAGTLGPVASAFSICALARPWRQNYLPGSNLDAAPFIRDPIWLTIINAIQLLIALIANMALLLNMTQRLRFSIAQPVTIVGWYISSICLISLTATASGPLIIEPTSQYIWSQAFYYGIYGAALYFLVASLMAITFLGAQTEHYPKDFVLTPSQRTLMMQTILLLFYLLLGALLFGRIEGWNYLDAVYWAAVTLFTVGFGDFSPQTGLGKGLVMPFALVGIISLGLVIGSIRSLVLDRGRRRLSARMVEKRRRRMLKQMTKKGKDGILVPIKEGEELRQTPSEVDRGLTEFERREKEFKLMRVIQKETSKKRRWYATAVSACTWAALWLGGARIFQACEEPYQGWTYFDGIFFCFVSLTTIGYGDIVPVSNAGKSFWVFWALLALPTMTVLISNAGDTVVKGIRDATDAIATITILPSERPFKKDLKRFLKHVSFGVFFKEEIIEETPTGILGEAQDRDNTSSDSEEENDAETALQRGQAESSNSSPTSPRVRFNPPFRNDDAHDKNIDDNTADENHPHGPGQHLWERKKRRKSAPFTLPNRQQDYLVILIDEVARVTAHLKEHPPRKYSFKEWAWYLRLIGEDESDAGQHGRASTHVRTKKDKFRGGRPNEGLDDRGEARVTEKVVPWSWVGSKSPLMGGKEEAEWILERLIERLGEELRRGRRGGDDDQEGEGQRDEHEGRGGRDEL